jgi:hypothetical protein
MQGLAFIASDALASVSCLDSDNLVHINSTQTGDIPPELSYKQCYEFFRDFYGVLSSVKYLGY